MICLSVKCLIGTFTGLSHSIGIFIFIESVKAETSVEDEKDDITDDTELKVTDFVICEISVCLSSRTYHIIKKIKSHFGKNK